MPDTEKENGTRNRTFAAWLARLSAIVTVLPASMFAGWLMGYFVMDRFLHSYPWGSILGTMLGAGAGFYEILRILMPRNGKGRPRDGGN
jgi:F0F1-type ATP synthase assembly protein I